MTDDEHSLTRQERQIMDLLYAEPDSSVEDVARGLGASYSATRAALTRLVQKGHACHRRSGARYLYCAATDAESAGRSAVGRIIRTFFAGSPAAAIGAVLGFSTEQLTADELDRIERLIDDARQRQKRGQDGAR